MKGLNTIGHEEHFKILGIYEGSIYFQIKETAQIHSIKMSNLSLINHLICIAPLKYWQSMCLDQGGVPTSEMSKKHCLDIADSIIRQAKNKGTFSPAEMIYGRGGAKIGSRYYYNLGDSVLFQDENNLLSKTKPIGDVEVEDAYFTPGGNIKMTDDETIARVAARKIYECISACRWKTPEHANAFAGFIVTSIIGGCLSYRPMLWLLGPTCTGKTWLLSNLYRKVAGDICHATGDTTAAALKKHFKSDSLPGHIDEFEPPMDSKQRANYNKLLTLIRSASTGELDQGWVRGERVKPRFSIILASRSQEPKADQSGFFFVCLAKESVTNSHVLENEIKLVTENHKMLALRSWIIRNTAIIANNTKKIEQQLTQDRPSMDSREKEITAALTAGCRFLSLNDRLNIIRSEKDKIENDQLEPLCWIMTRQITIKTEGETSFFTVGECIRQAMSTPSTSANNVYCQTLERLGMKIKTISNRCGCEHHLHIYPKNSEFVNLLKGSKYINIKKYLNSLDDVSSDRVYMAGKQVRALYLGHSLLSKLGLTTGSFATGD